MVGENDNAAAVRNIGAVAGAYCVAEIQILEYAGYPLQTAGIGVAGKKAVDLAFMQDVAQEVESRLAQQAWRRRKPGELGGHRRFNIDHGLQARRGILSGITLSATAGCCAQCKMWISPCSSSASAVQLSTQSPQL